MEEVQHVTVNKNIPSESLKNFVYELSDKGPGLWLATTRGAINATIPLESASEASVYYTSKFQNFER